MPSFNCLSFTFTLLAFMALVAFGFASSAEETDSQVFSVPCSFKTPYGAVYDFSDITRSKDLQIAGKRGVYYLGLCHNTFRACGGLETPLCISQPEPTFGFSSGGSLSSRAFSLNANGDVELRYSDGSVCASNDSPRHSTITLRCNRQAIEPQIVDLVEGCELSFVVESADACPLTDECRLHESSSQCLTDCKCGWCPSEGGICISADRDHSCYSSMRFGATCIGVSPPQKSQSNILVWLLPTIFGSVALAFGALVCLLGLLCGLTVAVRRQRQRRQAKRSQSAAEFELLAEESNTAAQPPAFETIRPTDNQPSNFVQPTAPELIDFSAPTQPLYPQLQPMQPMQPMQPVYAAPASPVMFYLPVTAQQFAQMQPAQQQAIMAAMQQQQQQQMYGSAGYSLI